MLPGTPCDRIIRTDERGVLLSTAVLSSRPGPPLSRVVEAFVSILLDGSLLGALAFSLQAWLVGFTICAVGGVWLGLMMARSPFVERVANPYLDIILAAPTIAFIPLLVVWFGLGM